VKVGEFNLEAERLIMEGYSPDAPNDRVREIDGSIANTTTCEECGFVGHYYRPFSNGMGSYRAYALCGGCSNVVEF
jgi:hypothetical protein